MYAVKVLEGIKPAAATKAAVTEEEMMQQKRRKFTGKLAGGRGNGKSFLCEKWVLYVMDCVCEGGR